MKEIADLDKQIFKLKRRRDRLIREAGLDKKELQRILAFRTPRRTICQLLRELHDVLRGDEQEKVADCLLMAKKMDESLRDCAGARYTDDWYDEKGEFIND